VLEHEVLYKRKAGEEITQQMYNFVDKEGHAVTLRPGLKAPYTSILRPHTPVAEDLIHS
jgi:histidyl-tRNA synthetase